jgi:EAL domain-containing protein (putative c-di-GMP-specific phosphodiesterase class I)/tetratricopeptide (TPR) repeat protein
VLVGRDEELAVLGGALLQAARGDGQLYVLSAEAGLGKTRVTVELHRQAERLGFTVLSGGCSDSDLTLPFLPFVEAIGDHLARADEARLREKLGNVRDELGALFPQPRLARSDELQDPARGKLRLFEAVLAFLDHLAEDTGLLLLVEDVQWADPSSRELLDYLARRLRQSRSMLLLTARSDEMHRRHPFLAERQAWQRAGLAEVVELRPLNADEVARMVSATLDMPDIPQELSDLLHDRSEGNPYVLEEMLKELIDAGSVPRPRAGWNPVSLAAALKIPRAVSESILMRVDRLSPAHADVLQAASVLGRSFGYPTLVALTGRADAEVLDALQVCVQQQLVEEDPQSVERYRFRHALTREAIYEDLMRPRRQALHSKAAEVLSQQSLTAAMELAHHMLAAGRWAEAVPVCIEAARDAVRRRGYAEAADLYQRVLPHVTDPAARAEVLSGMGEAYWLAGDPATAESYLADGIRLLVSLGDAATAARHRLILGRCHWERGRLAESAKEYEEARRVLEKDGPSVELAQAYIRLSQLHAFQFEGEDTTRLARQAIEVATRAGADEARIWAATTLGIGLAYEGHVGEGLEYIDTTYLDAADRQLDRTAVNALYSGIMLRLWNLRAADCPRLIDRMAEQPGGWLRDVLAGRARTATQLLLGDLSGALAAGHDVVAAVRYSGAVAFRTWIDRFLAIIHLELGQVGEAARLLPAQKPREERQELFFDHWARLRLAMARGETEAAATVADQVFEESEWTARFPLLVALAVEALVQAGRVEPAEALLAACREHGHDGNPYVSLAEGLVELGGDRPAAALGRLDDAARDFGAAGYRLDAMRARLALARARIAGGGAAQATDDLAAVLHEARETGAALIAAAARSLAARHGLDLEAATPRQARRGGEAPAPASDLRAPGRLTLAGELRGAVGRGELILAYQPKVSLKTRRMTGVEALVRWQHPRLGFLGPDRFIPVAEQAGMIKLITAWVLEAGLEQARRWRDDGVELKVSVNLAVGDLEDGRLVETVDRALGRSGLPAEVLVLEVTETGVLSQPLQAIESLKRLKAMGIGISIDDFGIGQSSLAYLQRLPADEIKIDKSFCLDLDERNLVIVRSAIAMGHDLDLKVAAEGVETLEVLETLAALGCDTVQGDFFGRAAEPAEVVRRARELEARAAGARDGRARTA